MLCRRAVMEPGQWQGTSTSGEQCGMGTVSAGGDVVAFFSWLEEGSAQDRRGDAGI